jgi:Tol biopolymer transport system component
MLAGCSSDTPSGDGGPHVLIASERGLTEVRGPLQKEILTYDDGSYLLDPALSPDGKRIAYIRQPPAKANPNGSVDFGADLYIADRNGKNAREVVRHGMIAEFVREPAWLPDGRLLFSVYGRQANGDADLRI